MSRVVTQPWDKNLPMIKRWTIMSFMSPILFYFLLPMTIFTRLKLFRDYTLDIRAITFAFIGKRAKEMRQNAHKRFWWCWSSSTGFRVEDKKVFFSYENNFYSRRNIWKLFNIVPPLDDRIRGDLRQNLSPPDIETPLSHNIHTDNIYCSHSHELDRNFLSSADFPSRHWRNLRQWVRKRTLPKLQK